MRPTLANLACVVSVLAAAGFCALVRAQTPALDRQAAAATVDAVASSVEDEYFDAAVGTRVARQLRADRDLLVAGATSPEDLAASLTRDLFALTRDKHLAVTRIPAPVVSGAVTPAQNRAARLEADRYGFPEAAILDGNVGYLLITSFYRPDEARDALDRAMRTVAAASALVLDLRSNTGGSPDTVALLASYLFDDRSRHLFDIVPRRGSTTTYMTSDVALHNGTRPIYVLTSSRTFSAGEGLAFILQEMKRATVIGERTAGAANPGRPYPAGDRFEVTVPNGQVKSAVSGRNWEGTGVIPDIATTADQARDTALALARRTAAVSGNTQTRLSAPRRFDTNPLITVRSSPTLGGNVNGPTVIRVPAFIQKPLGKYYMYFANHMGDFVRLAYADAVTGPWRIYEPGVLHVRDTAFYRGQPDPAETLADFYTHVASPEVFIDSRSSRLVMWAHGWWTNGERWPSEPTAARAWARQRGYGQFTQAAVSSDGLHFNVQPAITKTSYLRVFQRGPVYYGVSRLGVTSRSNDPLGSFDLGQSLFRATKYAGRVRHVGLQVHGDTMFVFFTAIGDAPEHVMLSTVDLRGDWTTWQASDAVDILSPEASYECTDLANEPSDAGDIDHPARQIRDPFVFEDEGKTYLFYSTCGEQGIAGAEIALP